MYRFLVNVMVLFFSFGFLKFIIVVKVYWYLKERNVIDEKCFVLNLIESLGMINIF